MDYSSCSVALVTFLEVRDKLTETHDAIRRIREVRGQLDGLRERLDTADAEEGQNASRDLLDADLLDAIRELDRKMTVVEEALYQTKNKSRQDPLNYPIKLNNKIAALQGVVEGGDGKPTQQSYTVFKELSSRLDAELAKLETALKADLPPFNKEIAAKKLETVK